MGTVINKSSSVRIDLLATWRRMLRIETTGGSVDTVIRATSELLPEKLVYAEGDSWFDKFTPIPASGTNLLEAIRTPFLSAVVDVSHIGDEVRDMVRGWQARQTRAMFNLFDFDAILLSAGGNDLKNIFAQTFDAQALAISGFKSPFQPTASSLLFTSAGLDAFFGDLLRNIGQFIDLRDGARRERTRAAPIFLHGYDYLQPRPSGASIFAGLKLGTGPWLYPAMQAAGLSCPQMLAATVGIIDELNGRLATMIAPLDNVFFIDQRRTLALAPEGSQGPSHDWLDEIHPTKAGFDKLARAFWDVPLSRALGWTPSGGDVQ